MDTLWPQYEEKMKAEGLNDAAIAAFKYNLGVLVSGVSTMIPDSTIDPVDSLPDLASLDVAEDASLLASTLMLKLNGGLGTGMGLDRAKSLLEAPHPSRPPHPRPTPPARTPPRPTVEAGSSGFGGVGGSASRCTRRWRVAGEGALDTC